MPRLQTLNAPVYCFDYRGWYIGRDLASPFGSTDQPPPLDSTSSSQGELRANWRGDRWVTASYWEPAELPERWRIHHAAFWARLGDAALAICAGESRACRALQVLVDSWAEVDLRNPQLAKALQRVQATGQPQASDDFPDVRPLTALSIQQILTTPTTEDERVVKGLP